MALTPKHYRGLVLGKVVGFTPKQVICNTGNIEGMKKFLILITEMTFILIIAIIEAIWKKFNKNLRIDIEGID